jgi:hypothetical protein
MNRQRKLSEIINIIWVANGVLDPLHQFFNLNSQHVRWKEYPLLPQSPLLKLETKLPTIATLEISFLFISAKLGNVGPGLYTWVGNPVMSDGIMGAVG